MKKALGLTLVEVLVAIAVLLVSGGLAIALSVAARIAELAAVKRVSSRRSGNAASMSFAVTRSACRCGRLTPSRAGSRTTCPSATCR